MTAARMARSVPPAGVAARALLIGCVAGARATFGAGIPTIRAGLGGQPGPVQLGAVTLMGAEMVWDQLPNCPSRLEWPGLLSRLVAGGAGAVLIARSHRQPAAGAAALGATGALLGALIGVRWRRRWSRTHPAWAGGVIEDAVALVVGGIVSR